MHQHALSMIQQQTRFFLRFSTFNLLFLHAAAILFTPNSVSEHLLRCFSHNDRQRTIEPGICPNIASVSYLSYYKHIIVHHVNWLIVVAPNILNLSVRRHVVWARGYTGCTIHSITTVMWINRDICVTPSHACIQRLCVHCRRLPKSCILLSATDSHKHMLYTIMVCVHGDQLMFCLVLRTTIGVRWEPLIIIGCNDSRWNNWDFYREKKTVLLHTSNVWTYLNAGCCQQQSRRYTTHDISSWAGLFRTDEILVLLEIWIRSSELFIFSRRPACKFQ